MLKQIGVVTSTYGHYTLEYALSSIAAAGFCNAELWAASPHYCYADYTLPERQQRREEIAALLKQNGLSMPVLYPEQMNKYTLNIAAAAPYTKTFSMDRILEYIDDAKFWGAQSMLLGTGWHHLDDPGPEKYQRSVAAIRQAAEYAAGQGITLLIEPAAPQTGTFAWDLSSLVRLLKDVDRENVKACLDLSSILDGADRVERWYKMLEGNVGHIHFADKGGRAPEDSGVLLMDELEQLERLGYNGTASVNITFRDCCLVPDRQIFLCGQWLKERGLIG